ncbi:MAG: SAM-dependent chlorinase/fluorinase [Candidatus Aegiribacteria sp.]|nr:SAM-dependent chlorinase/fluorinase [Candidatus Aegiribacteria sp.]
MNRVVFLLSDFGVSDTYVAQMKAVILSMSSDRISIIDLTHDIKAGSVTEGAFHLYVSRKVIPAGSVVVAVVDPGVGTVRGGVVCEVEGTHYVGPDNGLFGLLPSGNCWRLPDHPGGSSNTFHGRDVFAPAGARLILDPGWVQYLEPVDTEKLVPLEIETPSRNDDGLKVTVAHIDRFGNAVLWLSTSAACGFHPSELRLPDGRIESIKEVSTYADNPGILYLQGSQGFMEIAVSRGSASELLGLTIGNRILLRERKR